MGYLSCFVLVVLLCSFFVCLLFGIIVKEPKVKGDRCQGQSGLKDEHD